MYALERLKERLPKNTDLKVHVLYDIACILKSHLKVMFIRHVQLPQDVFPIITIIEPESLGPFGAISVSNTSFSCLWAQGGMSGVLTIVHNNNYVLIIVVILFI